MKIIINTIAISIILFFFVVLIVNRFYISLAILFLIFVLCIFIRKKRIKFLRNLYENGVKTKGKIIGRVCQLETASGTALITFKTEIINIGYEFKLNEKVYKKQVSIYKPEFPFDLDEVNKRTEDMYIDIVYDPNNPDTNEPFSTIKRLLRLKDNN